MHIQAMVNWIPAEMQHTLPVFVLFTPVSASIHEEIS